MRKRPLVTMAAFAVCVIIAAAFSPPYGVAKADAPVIDPGETVIETAFSVTESPQTVIKASEAEDFYDEVTDPDFVGYPEIDHGANWSEADVDMLARTLWGEARGIPSDMEKAAVVWCILNRVDDPRWPDTIAGVVTQNGQFAGYSKRFPVTDELKALAEDVLFRWQYEKAGGNAGRVLPADYFYFTGDGQNNHFRQEYKSAGRWDWSLDNPYKS